MIDYVLVNIFTDRPFAGSALGVVPNADALSSNAMRAIAAELNSAETTFVLAPSSPEATYRVRVFSPRSESPHGGHSCIGTAATLVRLGLIPAGPVTQECGAARQQLVAGRDHATLVAEVARPSVDIDPVPLLAAVGLNATDAGRGCSAKAAGFTALFPFLHVDDRAVGAALPDYRRMSELDLPAVCLYNWHQGSSSAHARVFAPGFDIPEDAACAPVALALGIRLAETDAFPSANGSYNYLVRQGIEIDRCSTLRCTVEVSDGRVRHATVTGSVSTVAAGQIAVPHSSRTS